MARGLRVLSDEVDLEGFRAFVEASGGVFDAPRTAAAEVLRFRVATSFGIVSRRKDRSFTFAGIAKPLFAKMNGGEPTRPPVKIELRTVTLHADRHTEARALLTDAMTANVHTDGSSTGQGVGAGGWACSISVGFNTIEVWGGARKTTVNRMELTAAIAALELLPPACIVRVFTDSQYVRRGITQWAARWQRNGWKLATGEPVKSQDLWERLLALTTGREVKWKWIKGHNGNRGNERVDELARQGRLSIEDQPREKADGERSHVSNDAA